MGSAELSMMTEVMAGAGVKPPVAEAPAGKTPPITDAATQLFNLPVAEGGETAFELPVAETPLPAESSPLAGLPEDVHVDGTNALRQVQAKGLKYEDFIGDNGNLKYKEFAEAMGWDQNPGNEQFSERGLQVFLNQHPDIATLVDQAKLAAELKSTYDIPADEIPAILETVNTEFPQKDEAEELSDAEGAFPHGQPAGIAEELHQEPTREQTPVREKVAASSAGTEASAPTTENPPALAEKWRVEPHTFPPGEEPRDREAYLQTLQETYQGNVDILIGTADRPGLLLLEQERIAAQQVDILTRKTELANRRRTEARRGRILGVDKVLGVFGLKDKDSVLVAKARGELNSAQKAERATEAQKAQFLDQERYTADERTQFAALYKLEGLVADTNTSFNDMLVIARDAGMNTDGLTTVDDIRKAFKHAPRNTRYQHFRSFYEGGEITIQGKEPIVIKRENGLRVLKENTQNSEQNLAGARAKEATTTRVIAQFERRLSRHEQRLLNYQRRLARIARFIQDGYRPDMAVMRATWAELDNATLNHDGLAEEMRGKEKRVQAGTLTREQMLNSKTEDRNGKQRKLVDLIKEAKQSGEAVSTRLARMRDPLRRLTEHEDLAQLRTELQRGLALRNATSERLAAEPRDVQMEAVIVRTLLGEMPAFQLGERTLLRRVAGAPVKPPTPPSGGGPRRQENPPITTSPDEGTRSVPTSTGPAETTSATGIAAGGQTTSDEAARRTKEQIPITPEEVNAVYGRLLQMTGRNLTQLNIPTEREAALKFLQEEFGNMDRKKLRAILAKIQEGANKEQNKGNNKLAQAAILAAGVMGQIDGLLATGTEAESGRK